GALESARGEGGGSERRGSRHGPPCLDGRYSGLGETGEMGQRKDCCCLGADEHRPSLPHQMRAGPELAERPDPGERHPRRTGIGIEQIERVCHRLCTKAFSLSGRPVGMTRVWPLARTTTMSSIPTTASSSLSAQITEFLTSSPSVTLPTVTLPRASRRRTRSSASHEPISSQVKVPVTTVARRRHSSA